MEAKAIFGVVVLAGVLLVGSVQGASHGGSHACNMTAFHACFTNATLASLEALDTNATGHILTREVLMNGCSAFDTLMKCATDAHCGKEDLTAVDAELGNFNPDVSCTESAYCYIDMMTCWANNSDLGAYLALNPNLTGLTNEQVMQWCPSVKNMTYCLEKEIPKRCHFYAAVEPTASGLGEWKRGCGERECEPLQQCRRDFEAAGPSQTGLDVKTCMLYRNYTKCADAAIHNVACSDVMTPKGHPTPGNISDIVYDACSLMDTDDYRALYSCVSFLLCLKDEMEDEDTLFLPNVCQTAQAVIGCAVKTAPTCPGVTNAATFVTTAKTLSLKAAAMGCQPSKEIKFPSCNKLEQCKNEYAMLQETDGFSKYCRAMAKFQKCAADATRECNLPVYTDPKLPTLTNISAVTEKVCDAMDGQNLSLCMDYLTCMSTSPVPMFDDGDGELITGPAWCGASVQALECAKELGESCAAPEQLKKTLGDLYKQLLRKGCPDTFDYLTGVDDDDDDDGTSCAPAQVGVSLVLMLLLSLIQGLSRLL